MGAFKGISQILVAKLLVWLSLFKLWKKGVALQSLQIPNDQWRRGVHILEMRGAQEQNKIPSKSDYL